MAAAAGRLIAAGAGFRLWRGLILRPGLFRPRTGLRLAPLEVFAECRGQPGLFCGIRGIGLFVHKTPVSRSAGGFKLCLRGLTPYGKPCPLAVGLLPRDLPERCGSSVVEHSLGKGEVESSILSHSTISGHLSRSLLQVTCGPRSRIFSARPATCRRFSGSKDSP